jgi:hypothetical protein
MEYIKTKLMDKHNYECINKWIERNEHETLCSIVEKEGGEEELCFCICTQDKDQNNNYFRCYLSLLRNKY